MLAQLTGTSSLKWINVEAPKVSNRRVDLLGELPDGNLVHIELQSANEKDFPLRMAEYLFGIGLRYGWLPRQVVLYVGQAPLLTRLGEQRETVRRILARTAAGRRGERDAALAELFIIAGLRRMEDEARREARKMPILNDIMDNRVIGPAIRQGRMEGQVEIVLSLIQKRFGRIPPAVGQRIAALKPTQLKRVAMRLLDAQSIEDLFAR